MGAKKPRRRKSASNLSSGSKVRTGRIGRTKRPPSVADAPAEDLGTPEANPTFSVVGVGASAGGLEAFTKLLQALPVDTGMAFVLVQHLAPSRESALAEILSRATSMPVMEVIHEPALEPNRVYVIPPGRNMVIVRGHLRLLPRAGAGTQHPIDLFFRSLAENQHHMAIGVVLSGTATDGTLGLEEIKAESGITFAQDESALYSGMPQSAVASGCVDFVLPPDGIAAEITRIAAHPYVAPTSGERATEPPTPHAAAGKELLRPILRHIRSAFGVDLTEYRTNTLSRRIRRRMVLQKQEGFEEYERFLRGNPAEVQALYHDILINVTSFFRNPDVFEAIKKRIRALLKDRGHDEQLRVWVAGCSTGEEAYSLAMILSEVLKSSDDLPPAQVFATDLNAASIEHARAGVYSRARLEDVSRERLSQFFVEMNGHFQVAKPIRDMCVFSQHNLMSDPPFSRMDVVSCRNLLIYLEASLQQRILPILHYALKPTGFLVLGASESVGRFSGFFGVEDKKHKIFSKKPGSGRLLLMPVQGARTRAPSDPAMRVSEPSALAIPAPAETPVEGNLHKEFDRLLLSFAPPAVLVDGSFQILEFRGNTDPYLSAGQGKASLALLKMARQDLFVPLRALLYRAKKENAPVHEENVRVGPGESGQVLNLEVLPVKGSATGDPCFLVIFRDARGKEAGSGTPKRKPGTRKPGGGASRETPGATIARLEQQLANSHEHLQSLSDQHEAAIEELQSSNEEAQSANEELQSINEELETSKEEIQSSNEELTTVNDELNCRNVELGQLNSDLTNLISNTQVAIVIVSRDLHIRRFSPMAEKLLGIIPSDMGRPITDIRMRLDFPELDSLLTEAIETVSVKEREIQAKDGRWHSLRIRPYLTVANKIDGAVLSLIDIDAVQRAREYAERIVATLREPLLILDEDLRVRSASRAFHDTFSATRETTEGRLFWELGNGKWDAPELRRLLGEILRRESTTTDFVLEHEFDGAVGRIILFNGWTLPDPGGEHPQILLSLQDITERKRLEADLRQRNEEFAAADRAKNQFIAMLSHELRSPLNAIRGWIQILLRPGTKEEDLRTGLDVIDRNSKAQAQLINDLLDIHRITAGKIRLELAAVDLQGVVASAVDAVLPAAADKKIRIVCVADPAPAVMSGDFIRLQQVLANLLANALKFTPKGGEIRVSLQQQGARAEVSVSDTGIGIAPAAMPYIFERFRQADLLSSRHKGGLGLGLAISKQLIELHGGTLTAQSPGQGKGATFTVSLPMPDADTPLPPVWAGSAAEEHSASLGGLLVLVVDDEPDAREPLRRVLEDAGAETVVVASADEALDALRQRQPDVIVSDIGMPGGDGYALLRTIRALPPKRGGRVPAIALTAYVASEDRDRALKAGFQAHLTKPVEPVKLIAAVAALAPSGGREDSAGRREGS